MNLLKIIFILVFLTSKSAIGQHFNPSHDSCVVIVHFLSTEKIPYSGRAISCRTEDNKSSVEITDSLGRAEFFVPKASNLAFDAFDGNLLIGNYHFSTPQKTGLFIIHYEIQEDFFTEDRTDEALIDTTWVNDKNLIPSSNMTLVEVNLTNDEDHPLPQTIVLFRDSISKNVYMGETNDRGRFSILIPKNQEYGVRITSLGNRIPICNLSTKFGEWKLNSQPRPEI